MKKIYICTLLAFILSACEKTVEVLPQNQVAPETVLTSIDGVKSVLNSGYDRMQGYGYYGRDFALLGDALADNIFTVTSLDTRYSGSNKNTSGYYANWATSYSTINDMNIVLANIDVVPGDETAKNTIKGEAYALRALMYFDIARVYCYEPGKSPATGAGAGFNKGAVLRLQPISKPEEAVPAPRSTIEETYAAIESDLKAAIAAFPNNGATDKAVYRMNKPASYALLGKVYLYWGKFAEANAQFDLALAAKVGGSDKPKLIGAGSYISSFATLPNPESFFELNWVPATEMAGVDGSNNSLRSYTLPKNSNPALGTFGSQSVSNELKALFEAGDERSGAAMFYTYGGYTWSNKYSGANGGQYTDNIKMIRYSDVLLMKAEAMAELGQYAPAADLVKQLRAARNASTATVPTDATLKDFIQDERRRELYFEGHRFFDLKRRGSGITKASLTAVGTIAYTDRRILSAIPTAEVDLLPTLPQNPGF